MYYITLGKYLPYSFLFEDKFKISNIIPIVSEIVNIFFKSTSNMKYNINPMMYPIKIISNKLNMIFPIKLIKLLKIFILDKVSIIITLKTEYSANGITSKL